MDRTDKGSIDRSSIENANKMRDLISSAGDPKPHHSEKLLEKKTLTLGMKLGLSQVSYKNKLLGEQVAYVIDDILTAVEEGRSTIESKNILKIRAQSCKWSDEIKTKIRIGRAKARVAQKKETWAKEKITFSIAEYDDSKSKLVRVTA